MHDSLFKHADSITNNAMASKTLNATVVEMHSSTAAEHQSGKAIWVSDNLSGPHLL